MSGPAHADGGHSPLAVDLPSGWRVRRVFGPGPFVIGADLVRPDGSLVRWTSRRHRKGLGLRAVERTAADVEGWADARAASVVLGGLFMVGSFWFALGSLPLYSDRVSTATGAWTFFVGSLFFTTAAYVQYREVITAPTDVAAEVERPPGLRHLADWAPHRIDWWSSTVQLVGTISFNITTFAATRADLSLLQERRWIWVPDIVGSICFLVASGLAWVEAVEDESGIRGRSIGWRISVVNVVGSIAFGLSAVAARYVGSSGEVADQTLVTLGTFVGAVCFFAGAALLPVESARESSPQPAP